MGRITKAKTQASALHSASRVGDARPDLTLQRYIILFRTTHDFSPILVDLVSSVTLSVPSCATVSCMYIMYTEIRGLIVPQSEKLTGMCPASCTFYVPTLTQLYRSTFYSLMFSSLIICRPSSFPHVLTIVRRIEDPLLWIAFLKVHLKTMTEFVNPCSSPQHQPFL